MLHGVCRKLCSSQGENQVEAMNFDFHVSHNVLTGILMTMGISMMCFTHGKCWAMIRMGRVMISRVHDGDLFAANALDMVEESASNASDPHDHRQRLKDADFFPSYCCDYGDAQDCDLGGSHGLCHRIRRVASTFGVGGHGLSPCPCRDFLGHVYAANAVHVHRLLLRL